MQDQRLLRVGGIAIIVAGILVALTIPLIPLIIPSLAPSSTESGLTALESQGTLYVVTWLLYFVSDVLYLVAYFGLYNSLRQASRNVAKIFLVLNTLFVAIDVLVDIPLRLWLVLLSSSYATTTGTQQQQAVSSASFAISTSNLVALVATLFQFVAVILASNLMAKNPSFGKSTSYIGYATGIVALLFIPAFLVSMMLAGIFNIGGFVLLVIWSILVGTKLRKVPTGKQS